MNPSTPHTDILHETPRLLPARKQVVLVASMHLLAILALGFPSVKGAMWLAAGWLLTGGFGVSLGYHRLLSHKSFDVPRFAFYMLTFLGASAWQGGPVTWVGFHRAHHRFTDRQGDPHAASRGFWWSHMAWIFFKAPNGYRARLAKAMVQDIRKDPWLSFLEQNHFTINVAVSFVALLLMGWKDFLWFVPLRVVLVWHLTWLVNSISHRLSQPNQQEPSALNRPLLALLNFGESLHANHHERPSSADFRRKRFDIDLGFFLLTILLSFRLATINLEQKSTGRSKTEVA